MGMLKFFMLMDQTGDNAGGGGGTPPSGGTAGGDSGGGSSGAFSLPDNWRDTLPDDIKAEPSLQTVNDFNGLVKSFVHAQKHIGSNKVVVPGKLSTDGDWEQFFEKVGRPKSADEYGLKAGEGENPELLKGFAEAAHKSGLLPKQVEGVLGFWKEHTAKSQAEFKAQVEAQRTQAQEALKKEWGAAYDQEMQKTVAMLKEHAGDELFQEIEKAGLGSSPAFLKFLNKIGSQFNSEDTIRTPGTPSNSNGAMTPEQATQEINNMLGDTNGPYWNSSHPNHGAAVQRMNKLYAYQAGQKV